MFIKIIKKESPIHSHSQNPSFRLSYKYNAKKRRVPPIKIESRDDFNMSRKNVDFVVLLKPNFSSIIKVL